MTKTNNTYMVTYRLKGEGMNCYTSETEAPSKKHLRESYDSSVIVKSIHTKKEYEALK